MRKPTKEKIPVRAKVCTLTGGTIVIATLIFSGYAGSPTCTIPGIDHPLWGLLVCIILWFAGWLITWGWKGKL